MTLYNKKTLINFVINKNFINDMINQIIIKSQDRIKS